jgi:hypothetical protein
MHVGILGCMVFRGGHPCMQALNAFPPLPAGSCNMLPFTSLPDSHPILHLSLNTWPSLAPSTCLPSSLTPGCPPQAL